MQRATLGLVLLCFGAGCDGQTVTYSGFYMSDFFPLDGTERSWKYDNMDAEEDYSLLSELDVEGSVLTDDQRYRIFTVSTRKECKQGVEECGAGWLYDYNIASSRGTGVTLHGYHREGNEPVEFAEPLRLTDVQMAHHDSRTTENVDGHNWTTTFHGVDFDCDQTMPVQWECARIELVSDPPGHWLSGMYWAAAGYNVVAFKRADDTGKWRVEKTPTWTQ